MALSQPSGGRGPRFEAFTAELRKFIPDDAIFTDALRCYAYGTDASCYRMVPEVVVRAPDEPAVVRLIQTARRHGVGLTFRTAGTSLAGQAVTDSVLVLLTLASTARWYSRGTAPPTTWLSKSILRSLSPASNRIFTTANWPWPPDCLMCRPSTSTGLRRAWR